MSSLAKSAIYIFVFLVVAKILSVAKEVALASFFGTSYVVDAYTIACTFPTILYTLFNSGLLQSYIPVISRLSDNGEKKLFFSNVACILGIVTLLVSLSCYIFADYIARFLAPGFSQTACFLAADLIRCMAIYFPFYTIFSLFCVQSAADEDFIFSNFCDAVIVNIVIIVFILV